MRSLTPSGVHPGIASAAIFVLLTSITPASADVVVLAPSRDNTLIEDLSGSLSNGAGNAFITGRTGQRSRSIRRGLLAFDVGSAIPPGATITNAILTLHMSKTPTGPTRVNLHKVASDWGEGASVSFGAIGAPAEAGDATWFHTFFSDRFWAVPGGDFFTARRATMIVDQPGFYSWGPTDDLVADIQSWLDEPTGNFGWMLIGEERTPGTAKRFDSREFPEEARRPALMIEFSVPCTKSTGAPGAGYWRRQCLAIPAGDGGLDPSSRGRGPARTTEAGFVDRVLPCAEATLADLGFTGYGACGAIGNHPPADCHPNALRRLTTLVFNLCAGRLSTSCPLNDGSGGCGASSIGELIDDLAARIHAGDCLGAIRCSGG
ncbi:MAG: DNRLRE domain-containing protein [Acidobacteria bacterium]|nr:DNRLRE domain-containing protein [Acidobacteriota bacterium]